MSIPTIAPSCQGELAHLQSLGSAVSVSISRTGLFGKGHLLWDTTGGKCPAYQNEKIKEKKYKNRQQSVTKSEKKSEWKVIGDLENPGCEAGACLRSTD